MLWVEILATFLVCHLVGDYMLQTEWMATHKRGGLGRNAESRRALAAHVVSYTAPYVPALVWIGSEHSARTAVLAGVAIAVPHGVQDDGHVMRWWMRRVKHTADAPGTLAMMVDQSFHALALFIVALAIGN